MLLGARPSDLLGMGDEDLTPLGRLVFDLKLLASASVKAAADTDRIASLIKARKRARALKRRRPALR